MEAKVTSTRKLEVYPSKHNKEAETIFIEDILKLKNEGDSILLTRRNASGLSCLAYLESQPMEDLLEDFAKPFERLNAYGIEIISNCLDELRGLSHRKVFIFINDLLQVRAREIRDKVTNRHEVLVIASEQQSDFANGAVADIDEDEESTGDEEWECPYCGSPKAAIGIGCRTEGCQGYYD